MRCGSLRRPRPWKRPVSRWGNQTISHLPLDTAPNVTATELEIEIEDIQRFWKHRNQKRANSLGMQDFLSSPSRICPNLQVTLRIFGMFIGMFPDHWNEWWSLECSLRPVKSMQQPNLSTPTWGAIWGKLSGSYVWGKSGSYEHRKRSSRLC